VQRNNGNRRHPSPLQFGGELDAREALEQGPQGPAEQGGGVACDHCDRSRIEQLADVLMCCRAALETGGLLEQQGAQLSPRDKALSRICRMREQRLQRGTTRQESFDGWILRDEVQEEFGNAWQLGEFQFCQIR